MLEHEADLIARARQGDSDAYAKLYQEYSPKIFRFFRGRLHGSPEIADDLTAIVFLKVWQKLSLYVDRGQELEAWIFQIARHGFIDYVRRLPRYTSASLECAVSVADRGASDDYVQALDRQVLHDALVQLGAEQRQTVQLRFLEGRTSIETGVLMGRSSQAVKKLQARALANLRRLLSPIRTGVVVVRRIPHAA